jgi:hypothetical protein
VTGWLWVLIAMAYTLVLLFVWAILRVADNDDRRMGRR